MVLETHLSDKNNQPEYLNTFLALFDTRHDMCVTVGRCKFTNNLHKKYLLKAENTNKKTRQSFSDIINVNGLFNPDFSKSALEEERVMMAFARMDPDRFEFETASEVSNAEITDDEPRIDMFTPFMLDVLQDHDSKFVKFVVTKVLDYPNFVSEALQQRFGNTSMNRLNIHTDYLLMYFYREKGQNKLLEGADYQVKINTLASFWDTASKDNDNSVDALNLPIEFNINKDLFMPPGYSMNLEWKIDAGNQRNYLLITLEKKGNAKYKVKVIADEVEHNEAETYNILGANKVSLSVKYLCIYLAEFHQNPQKGSSSMVSNPLTNIINNFVKDIPTQEERVSVFANIMYNLKRSLDYLQVHVVNEMNEFAHNKGGGEVHMLATGDRLCFMKAVLEGAPAMLQRKRGGLYELFIHTGNGPVNRSNPPDMLMSLMKRIHGRKLTSFDVTKKVYVDQEPTRENHWKFLKNYFDSLVVPDSQAVTIRIQTYGDLNKAVQTYAWNIYCACISLYKSFAMNFVEVVESNPDIMRGGVNKVADEPFVKMLALLKQMHPFITNLKNRFQKRDWRTSFSTNFGSPFYEDLSKIKMNESNFIQRASKMLKKTERVDSVLFIRFVSEAVSEIPNVDVREFQKMMIRVVTMAPFNLEIFLKYKFPDPTRMRGEPKGYAGESQATMNRYENYKMIYEAAVKLVNETPKLTLVNMNKMLSNKIRDMIKKVDDEFYKTADDFVKQISAVQQSYRGKRGKESERQKVNEFADIYEHIAKFYMDFNPRFQEKYDEANKTQIGTFTLLMRQLCYRFKLSKDDYEALVNEVSERIFGEMWSSFNSMPRFLANFIRNALTNSHNIVGARANPAIIEQFEDMMRKQETFERLDNDPNALLVMKDVLNGPTPFASPVSIFSQQSPEIATRRQPKKSVRRKAAATRRNKDEAMEIFYDAVEDFVTVYEPVVEKQHPIVASMDKIRTFVTRSLNMLNGLFEGGSPSDMSIKEVATGKRKRESAPSPEKPANAAKGVVTRVESDIDDFEFSWERLEEVKELLIIKCFIRFTNSFFRDSTKGNRNPIKTNDGDNAAQIQRDVLNMLAKRVAY